MVGTKGEVMRTIELTATVSQDGKMVLELPPDVEPGDYQMVVVIADHKASLTLQPVVSAVGKFPVIDIGSWPTDLPLTREELYDDAGQGEV
jgi:hypothetical protein